MAKLTAPNPALFDPDALEQTFAKGVTARDNTAGLSAAWLLLQGADRARDQDKYMGALNTTNAMDAALQRQEMVAKTRQEAMKNAAGLIKEGFAPSNLVGGGDVVTGDDPMTGLLRDLVSSKIFANRNKGAGGGGAGGKPTTTVQTQMTGWGAPGVTTVTSKNADPNAAHAANAAAMTQVVNDMKKNPQNYTNEQKKAVMQQLMMNSNKAQPGIED
jgi:hypothetical protein